MAFPSYPFAVATRSLFRALTLALLVSLTSACAARQGVKVGDIPPPTLPTQEKQVEAKSFINSFASEQGYSEIKKGAELQRAQRVVDRLTIAAGFPAKTFPIQLLDAGEEVNAMAVNDARIVIFRELLVRAKNDDELAVVLAHEVGHVLGRHTEESNGQDRESDVSIGSSLLGTIAAVATSAAGYGGLSDLAGDVTETTTNVIGYGAYVRAFDREQEYEADHIGLMVMAKAGYDPKVAISFWKRSAEIFGSDDSDSTSFFSTHPASADRVEALEQALPFAEQYYAASKSQRTAKAIAPKKKAAGK